MGCVLLPVKFHIRMTTLTSQARTVNALLEANHAITLRSFLDERRQDNKSYRMIARELLDATDGVVDVTGETIRNWATDLKLLTEASA